MRRAPAPCLGGRGRDLARRPTTSSSIPPVTPHHGPAPRRDPPEPYARVSRTRRGRTSRPGTTRAPQSSPTNRRLKPGGRSADRPHLFEQVFDTSTLNPAADTVSRRPPHPRALPACPSTASLAHQLGATRAIETAKVSLAVQWAARALGRLPHPGSVRERRGAGGPSARGSGPFRCDWRHLTAYQSRAPCCGPRRSGLSDLFDTMSCTRSPRRPDPASSGVSSARRARRAVGAEAHPMAFSTGWGSGINAYLVVLVLGLADRILGIGQIPDAWLTDVLIGAGILFAVEMVADKIPYVDSVCRTPCTPSLRPVGATIGYLLGHGRPASTPRSVPPPAASPPSSPTGSRRGCGRRSTPLPEPASNVVVSTTEDVAVTGVTAWRSPIRGSPPRSPSCSCSSAASSSTRSPVGFGATSGATTPGVNGSASPSPPTAQDLQTVPDPRPFRTRGPWWWPRPEPRPATLVPCVRTAPARRRAPRSTLRPGELTPGPSHRPEPPTASH